MEELESARQRLARYYDPDILAELARELALELDGHFKQVLAQARPVLPWREPAENVRDASACLERTPAEPDSDTALNAPFRDLVRTMLDRGHNLHHPRYIGHQVPASVPLAGLFDAVGAITNQVMAIYEMGPWATAVELALIEQLGVRIGWKSGAFSGLITHGGSLANLTALLTARNVALGDAWEEGIPRQGPAPVLVVQADAHYCVARSAGILGLGTRHVVRVPLDERRRMKPGALDSILSDLRQREVPIIAVTACACATPIGAFDPLREIAEVCRKHGVWLHVDAAHGGGALFSDRHRSLLDGLELADSVVIDAHKMLFVPGLCAFVLYRDAVHRFETFRQDAPYLFDPAKPGLADYDIGLRTIECTKRAAGFGLWGLWSLCGPRLFGDLVDVTFATARLLFEKLKDAPDFEPLHEPQGNIVTFRHLPPSLNLQSPADAGEFQLRLRRRVAESGAFYLVSTQLDGVGALRTVVINPLTGPSEIDALLNCLRTEGQALLRAGF